MLEMALRTAFACGLVLAIAFAAGAGYGIGSNVVDWLRTAARAHRMRRRV